MVDQVEAVVGKIWWKSKTLWANGITMLIAMLGIVIDQPWMPAKVVAVCVSVGLPLLNIALRLITGEPISMPTKIIK